MLDWRDYGNGVYAFDAGYVRPFLAAIHMLVENGRVALVDTGSKDSLPNTLAALRKLGLGPDAVDFIILTHIHLDHAGGASSMMQMFPKARLVVHPRGARHMAEPSKLVAGVTAVYGAEYVRHVYGDILPIPVTRIEEAPEGHLVSLAGRELMCLDTPGHARHHLCLLDRSTGCIFSGDMFGLSYREMDVADRQFIFPTTTPSQFEPEVMVASIKRLMELQPGAIYLTHYSQIRNVPQMGRDLLRRLQAHLDIASRESDSEESRQAKIKAALTDYLLDEAKAHGCKLTEEELLRIWATDLDLNAQGLVVWLDGLKQ